MQRIALLFLVFTGLILLTNLVDANLVDANLVGTLLWGLVDNATLFFSASSGMSYSPADCN